MIDARLDEKRSISVRVVADEFGTYAVLMRGLGIDAQGTAKLDSEPHLGLLWSEDGSVHIAFTLFALPETHGLRGFAKIGQDTWTWELALQPLLRVEQGRQAGNVVSLADRRRR